MNTNSKIHIRDDTPCQTTPHGYIVTLKIIRGSLRRSGANFTKKNVNREKTHGFLFVKRKIFKERSRLTFAVKNGNVIGGQSRLGLDTDQQGTSTSGSNAFSWEMNALETQ